MTFSETETYLKTLHGRGIRPGLERMERAMQLGGSPHRRLRIVHVAGTNGKGSVARMIQSMLTAGGYRTGLYTSPSVTGLCDTLSVDDRSISPEQLAALATIWRERQARMGACGELSEFEFVTAMMFDYFSQERTDICVVECGMGGREDATNICPPPLVAVLTPIAMDHTAFLGDTIERIAAEKCGIIKSPCRVVTSPAQDPAALAVIYAQAAQEGLTVHQPNRAAAVITAQSPGSLQFSYAGIGCTIPMGGDFQLDNALTAWETMDVLAGCGFPTTPSQRRDGLSRAVLPGRQEVISRSPLIMLDGAHNVHGVTALCHTLRTLDVAAPLTLVYGMLRDKDTQACARLLAPLASTVICCTPPSDRALDAGLLAKQFIAAGADVVKVEEDPQQAVLTALCGSPDAPVVVGGSFYTVAAVRPLLQDWMKKKRK